MNATWCLPSLVRGPRVSFGPRTRGRASAFWMWAVERASLLDRSLRGLERVALSLAFDLSPNMLAVARATVRSAEHTSCAHRHWVLDFGE
jgi:hypothetical protein